MIYLPTTKAVDSADVKVATGITIAAEGIALVRLAANQADGVLPATGTSSAAAEVFAGFSIAGTSAAPFPEGYATKVEKFIVPGSGTVTLSQTPVSGQVSVFDVTLGAPDTSITVTGAVVGTLTIGSEVNVTYKYALTVVQARALVGDTQPGGYSGAYVGQIGMIKRGTIFTDQFDAAVNWAAATGLKMKANGIVTDQTGVGNSINGAIVAVPGVDNPFLGIEFSAF